MKTTTFLPVLAALLALPASHAQQSPSPSPQQSPAQACLASLPPAPKPPPPPPPNLFPAFQQKMDDMIRRAGGDPVAMRQAAAQAANQAYQDKLQAYNQSRSACFALPQTPAAAPAAAPISTAPPCQAAPVSATAQQPR